MDTSFCVSSSAADIIYVVIFSLSSYGIWISI